MPARAIETEVRELVLQLARMVLRRSAAPCPGASGQAVLLHADGDGVRCLIMRARGDDGGATAALSAREREIAGMVAGGDTTAAIAAKLGISTSTVATHLRRSFAKVGVTTRAALVARLLEGA